MADDDIALQKKPTKPEWHVVRTLLKAIVWVVLVTAVVGALGGLTYAIFGFTGVVIFALAAFLLLTEAAAQFSGWLLGKLFQTISPAIPEPILQKFQIAFAIAAIGGSVAYCVWALNMR